MTDAHGKGRVSGPVVNAIDRPGDRIIYQVSDANHYQVDTSIAYYLGSARPGTVFQGKTQVTANSLQPAECADPSTCITGTPRIWVVYVDHLAADPFSALPSSPTTGASDGGYLQVSGYLAQRTWQENGITVALLTVG